MRVAAVLMEILRQSGVRHLFGNPGTTELTFLDALPDSGLEYVVALQEATAVAAAEGYAQASGQVGVVNVHASYAILKSGMLTLGLDSAKRDIYPGMDLVDPHIDYLSLARALGVRAERVEKPDVLGDVLRDCLAHPGPTLVDVAIDRGFSGMGGPEMAPHSPQRSEAPRQSRGAPRSPGEHGGRL
jgi:benzoylformate decarboxylase